MKSEKKVSDVFNSSFETPARYYRKNLEGNQTVFNTNTRCFEVDDEKQKKNVLSSFHGSFSDKSC